jgi:hypothetical protein
MIHLATALVLALAPTGDHSALHPVDSNLYLEMPDLSAALAAYRQAPLVRMAMDEEIAGLVRGTVGLPGDFDLVEGLLGQAEAMLDAASFGLIGTVWAIGMEVRSLSVSFTELAGGERSDALERELQEEPIAALLRHLGTQVVLEFDGAGPAERMLAMLAGLLPPNPARTGPQTIELLGEERQLHRFSAPIGGDAVPPIWMLTADRLLIVGMGTADPEALASRAAGGASLLVGREGSGGSELFTNPAGATVYSTSWWLPSVPVYAGLLGDAAWAGIVGGLLGTWVPIEAQTSRSRLQLRDGRFVKETFERRLDPQDESVPVTGHAPLDPATLSRVGPEAIWVWATTVSREGLKGMADALIEALVVDGLGSVEEDLPADLLAGVGPQLDRMLGAVGADMVLYLLPIAGLKVPQLHAVLGLEEPAVFEKAVTELAQQLEEKADGMLSLDTRPYRRQPVITLRPDLERLGVPAMISLDLTIGIVGDRAIVGLSAMDVKKEIRSLLTGEAGAHALSAKGGVPKGVSGVSYMDWGTLVGGVYDMARTLGALIPDMGLPVDLSQLPESKLFTRFFQPSLSWSRPIDGGSYSYSESSFGPEVLIAGIAAAGAFGFSREESLPFEVALGPPATDQAGAPGETALLDLTRQALQEVKLGLVLHRSERGDLPPTLAALLEPSEAFPGGYLRRETLPTDGWGRALRYERTGRGQGFELWSLGPNGEDEQGLGDDIQAP